MKIIGVLSFVARGKASVELVGRAGLEPATP
jgi:hypothetical protein